MRLRFLEMVGARCARTVALSSAAVLGGDGAVVEVVGHEVARDYRPTSMLRDGAGAAVPRLLVPEACAVAICCWASFRGARQVCNAAAAAAKALQTTADHSRESAFKQRCVRARGFSLLWVDTNEYCTGQRTDNLARPTGKGYCCAPSRVS